MAGGAPLPVREYANGEEMLERYAQIRRETYSPKPLPKPVPAFRPQQMRCAAPEPASIPEPDRDLTIAAFERARAASLKDRKSLNDMLRIVCVTTRLEKGVILSERRTAPLVKARQIAMYLMVRLGKRSLPEVGRVLGGRDHSTVHHGCTKLDAFIPRLGLSNCSDPVRVAEKLWDTDWSLFREAAR